MEPYLCVGGIETAYNRRTLAYLRNMGHPGLMGGPGSISTDCGCDLGAGRRALAVTLRADLTDPVQACVGVPAITDGIAAYGLFSRVYEYAVDPGGRPAVLPDPDDPAWLHFPFGPLTSIGVSALYGCFPYDSIPTPAGMMDSPAAAFVEVTLVHQETGATLTALFYFSVASFGPGDPGDLAWSWDGGATWIEASGPYTEDTHTFEVLVPNDGRGGVVQTLFAADDEALCQGIMAISGLEGELILSTLYFPTSTPDPAHWPGLADPGWVVIEPPGPAPIPLPSPLGTCFPYNPVSGHYDTVGTPAPADGYYVTRISEVESGRTIDLTVGARNSAAVPGAAHAWMTATPDDPASWQPSTSATMTFPWGDAILSSADFTTPAEDDAPWYDPAVPESADVLGVWLEDATLSTPYKRELRQRMWGGSLGRAQLTGREIVVSGAVLTRSCEATEYARQWLFEALEGGCADECDGPDVTIYTGCKTPRSDGERTLKRVGLIDFQWHQDDDNLPCCWGAKFEATLAAEVPYLYRTPVRAYNGPVVDPAASFPICTACGGAEIDCTPLDTKACSCSDTDIAARVANPADDLSEFCAPVEIHRLPAVLAGDRLWTDATAIITIAAGDDVDPSEPGFRNLRIRAWPNPLGLTVEQLRDSWPMGCEEPCLDMDVSCLPRGAVLTIDGTTQEATVRCAGQLRDGSIYLSSREGTAPFDWPEIGCRGLVLIIDTDTHHTAADTRMTIDVVGRERA